MKKEVFYLKVFLTFFAIRVRGTPASVVCTASLSYLRTRAKIYPTLFIFCMLLAFPCPLYSFLFLFCVSLAMELVCYNPVKVRRTDRRESHRERRVWSLHFGVPRALAKQDMHSEHITPITRSYASAAQISSTKTTAGREGSLNPTTLRYQGPRSNCDQQLHPSPTF